MTDTKQDLEIAIKLVKANEIANRFGFTVKFESSEINLKKTSVDVYTVNSVDEYLGFVKGWEAGRVS